MISDGLKMGILKRAKVVKSSRNQLKFCIFVGNKFVLWSI